ncbi:arsenate-mycothiol transferase ArsC [Thiocystis violacea]|uniref:arsenate-mycothiol transferase ArsC n=1 Tax=Thiocystis violacea TaxID=13725 RepID=UPI0019033C9C|nr:hypothetical protein [Thiocystis violacea]
MKQLLFLCTGNYYRSRFAEVYFNHHAGSRGLRWRADSRALARDLAATGTQGPISRFALAACGEHGIPMLVPPRYPIMAEDGDFAAADRIIALSRLEHEPMVCAHFPAVLERVEFLEIGDIDIEQPSAAIARLARHLDDIIMGLGETA